MKKLVIGLVVLLVMALVLISCSYDVVADATSTSEDERTSNVDSEDSQVNPDVEATIGLGSDVYDPGDGNPGREAPTPSITNTPIPTSTPWPTMVPTIPATLVGTPDS